jgi:hypothetical protein
MHEPARRKGVAPTLMISPYHVVAYAFELYVV